MLSIHYNVIIFDLIGSGSSSRPKWDKISGAEADQYFVRTIENWRVGMDNLTDFYVVAHSYGGYIMGTYASLYP